MMNDRIRQLERERNKDSREMDEKRRKLQEIENQRLLGITQKFAAEKASKVQKQLQIEVVGLQTSDEYQRKRTFLSQGDEAADYLERKRQDDARLRQKQLENKEKERQAKAASHATLSFEVEEEEQAQEEEQERTEGKRKKLGKDPQADTTFLPDPDRDAKRMKEAEDRLMKAKAEEEFQKQMIIPVAFNYYDGNDHRRCLTIRKGAFIADFLDLVRQEIHELRGVSIDNLVFVKSDHIVPNHFTFYELLQSKHVYKGIPLFDWDVTPKEKQQNMHLYPANSWKPYDPTDFAQKQETDDPFVKVFKAVDPTLTTLPKLQRPI